MLKGKKIILGITGSIAAYKAAYLTRLLIKEGAEVQVILTPAGSEFITPVTMSALSGKPVLSTFFKSNDGSWNSHVDLGLWADAMIIAPATANTLGKMVTGICDNFLLTTYLSVRCPVFIAPAMDLDMFMHPSTIKNIATLKSWGCNVIEPGTGFLASGLEGKGRMEEPEIIVEKLNSHFSRLHNRETLKGKRVMVTLGPTNEPIDPVRFISNYSSGKMGFALVNELAARGAEVKVVAGTVQLHQQENPLIERFDVKSAREMLDHCKDIFPTCHVAIMAAAVCDYAPADYQPSKIKRAEKELVLKLMPNPDIAAEMGKIKKPGQLLAGFALETDNAIENASKKLTAKNLDFIVVNSLSNPGSGFMTDTNQVTILNRRHEASEFGLKTKNEVAADIVDYIENLMQ